MMVMITTVTGAKKRNYAPLFAVNNSSSALCATWNEEIASELWRKSLAEERPLLTVCLSYFQLLKSDEVLPYVQISRENYLELSCTQTEK